MHASDVYKHAERKSGYRVEGKHFVKFVPTARLTWNDRKQSSMVAATF